MDKFIENELSIGKHSGTRDKLPTDIKHLLARSLAGISFPDKAFFANKSREEVIELLLKSSPLAENLPLKDYDSIQSSNPDQRIGLGKTWILDYNYDSLINDKRRYSLKNWMMSILYQENNLSLAPRMFLFWSDLFSLETKKINFAPRSFNHFNIIRHNSIGNYKELLLKIITDQALLHYFKKVAPVPGKFYQFILNKILDRFSLGPEYAHHISKEKIKKLSRLLNKWSLICDSMVLHYKNLKPLEIYNPENIKYQDAYFNKSDSREVIEEISYLLEGFLKHPLTGQNLTRRLFKWFVHPEIDEEAFKKIIEPVSNEFIGSKFEIRGWLKAFFRNEYFYQKKFQGCLVKSPVDFLFTICKQAEVYPVSPNSFNNYPFWDWLRFKSESLGQDIGDPPGNDGWPAYNEIPYQKSWLSPESLNSRYVFTERLIDSGFTCREKNLLMDPVKFVSHFSNPSNPDALIDELIHELYAVPLSRDIKSTLKEIYLLEGRSDDYFWTNCWNKGIEHKNKDHHQYVVNQLKQLTKYLLSQPEYQYY